MKKELKKLGTIMLVMCMLIISTGIIYAGEDGLARSESKFEIVILDNNGSPVSDVNVALYSFLDKKVVANEITDSNGNVQINYKPHLTNFGDNEYIYGDYMIYAQKDGEEWPEYNLTKLYVNPEMKTLDIENAADLTNSSKYTIQQPTNKIMYTKAAEKENESRTQVFKKIKNQLISEKKLTKESPIYVLEEKDYTRFEEKGLISKEERALLRKSEMNSGTMAGSDYSLRNKLIPLGNFHISSGGELQVSFTSSDQVKVECGMKSTEDAKYRISGSRTRGLESTTTFPKYTTTKAKGGSRRYSTGGDFEEWQTVTYYGSVNYHVGIKKINGGMTVGGEGSCSTCGVAYASATSDHGTCVTILSGGSYNQTAFRNKTVNLGMNVSLPEVDVSLGVTRITGASTTLKYTAKKGYNLRIYNNDKSTWHCTQKAV